MRFISLSLRLLASFASGSCYYAAWLKIADMTRRHRKVCASFPAFWRLWLSVVSGWSPTFLSELWRAAIGKEKFRENRGRAMPWLIFAKSWHREDVKDCLLGGSFFDDGVWPFGLGGRALNVYVWCFFGEGVVGEYCQARVVAVIQQHTGHWPFDWRCCY